MDDPSQSMERTWTLLATGSLFMSIFILNFCAWCQPVSRARSLHPRVLPGIACMSSNCKESRVDIHSGKSKGGAARALVLSPERRKEISEGAVQAKRERALLPKAICGSDDRRLVIGDIEIQCYVLENEVRVLSLRTLQSGIRHCLRGAGKGVAARKIPALMARLAEKGINIMGLDVRANDPLRFLTPAGAIADGYDATILPDICAVLINAAREKVLDRRYKHLASRRRHARARICDVRNYRASTNRVTGYNDFKKAHEFGRIIEAFVAKEMRPYLPKFPAGLLPEKCVGCATFPTTLTQLSALLTLGTLQTRLYTIDLLLASGRS